MQPRIQRQSRPRYAFCCTFYKKISPDSEEVHITRFKKLDMIVNYIYDYVQGSGQTLTRYGFEKQVYGEYTRAAYSMFHEHQYNSTAFRIKTSQEHPTIYLVHHYNQSRKFSWSRHEFRVLADEDAGKFECECKLWEHTGTNS